MALMLHPMETGLRSDASGNLIPAHYITDVTVSIADRVVLEAQFSIAVAKDPLISFRFRGGRRGDPIRVAWVDNQGLQGSEEAVVD